MIKVFQKKPDELLNLDILDGSPPCTTFQFGQKREETCGSKKLLLKDNIQVLDDLVLIYVDLIKRLICQRLQYLMECERNNMGNVNHIQRKCKI